MSVSQPQVASNCTLHPVLCYQASCSVSTHLSKYEVLSCLVWNLLHVSSCWPIGWCSTVLEFGMHSTPCLHFLAFPPQRHARSWRMIGRGQTFSVASLQTRTVQEFMAPWLANLTWWPLWKTLHIFHGGIVWPTDCNYTSAFSGTTPYSGPDFVMFCYLILRTFVNVVVFALASDFEQPHTTQLTCIWGQITSMNVIS